MTTGLFAALAAHDAHAVAAALRTGADPDAVDAPRHGWRPLHAAVDALEDGGELDALVLLLRAGATVDSRTATDGTTPLLMACFRGQGAAVRLLLAAGADPNATGGEGDSPLRWWAEAGDRELAALVLHCGATATIDDYGGFAGVTALGIAAGRLDRAMVELLLAHGADPAARDGDGRTAWERLAPGADPALVAMLAPPAG